MLLQFGAFFLLKEYNVAVKIKGVFKVRAKTCIHFEILPVLLYKGN